MLFPEQGNPHAPTVILLHGGGVSAWSLDEVTAQLSTEYHVVTPILDGCGEDAENAFVSIEDSARKLVSYIRRQCGGQVFALGGLSIGAQIVVEALCQLPDAAQHAVLESALVCPILGTRLLTVPMCRLSYGLIQKRWFARMQAKQLCVPERLFERYYADSLRLSKRTLVNMVQSNGTYAVKPQLAHTTAHTLILVGEKEIRAERKSAELLHRTVPHSTLYRAPGLKHGELSLTQPERYVQILRRFFAPQTR